MIVFPQMENDSLQLANENNEQILFRLWYLAGTI